MNGLSKREKSLLVILGLAIVFYLYYSFFFKPIMGRADVVKGNVDKYQMQVDRIRNAKTLIEKQKGDLEKLKVDLLESLKIMPDSERNTEISINLKKMAIAKGAGVDSINIDTPIEFKPQENEKKNENTNQNGELSNEQTNNQNLGAVSGAQGEKVYGVPVRITVSGDYNQIMNFISDLEKDNRIAQVGELNLSKTQGKLTGNLSISFYYSGRVSGDQVNYDFNEGKSGGKEDLFK